MWVKGRLETIGPLTNFLELLLPQINCPRNTMSLQWYVHPCNYASTCAYCIIQIDQSRDIVFRGILILGSRGPRKFLRGPIRWGDGTTRNNVSQCECSGTPGPQINRPLLHNVPGLIHSCHFAPYTTFRLLQNDRDLSMQGDCAPGRLILGTRGPRKFVWGHIVLGRPITPTLFNHSNSRIITKMM